MLLYLHVNMVGLSIFCRLQVMLLGLSFVYLIRSAYICALLILQSTCYA